MDLASAPIHTVELPSGPLRYRDVGSGPTLLLVHGLLVDGLLWRDTVPLLADGHRCVVPDLPLGAHQVPAAPGADLSPPALARLLSDLVAALGLRDVVLVGNDTGGAICQLVAASRPDWLAGLVLTNADALESFPPRALLPAYWLGRTRPGAAVLAAVLRGRLAQRAVLASVSRRPFDAELAGGWLRRISDPAIRRDVRRVVRGVHRRDTLAAAATFGTFDRPVLLVWGTGDRLFFPVRLAERLAAAFADARLVLVPGARTFVPLDAPGELAAAVADFARERRVV